MSLTDSEKTDIRRFCGYPAYGAEPPGNQSWRFYQSYGLLEFRMNHLSPSELIVVRRYLGTLIGLEVAIPQSGVNLDTDQAAVWTRNRNEVQDRSSLFDDWCRRLCAFLGVPRGTGFGISGIAVVV